MVSLPLKQLLNMTAVTGLILLYVSSTKLLDQVARIYGANVDNVDKVSVAPQGSAEATRTNIHATESKDFYQHNLCIVVFSRASGFETRSCQRKICRPVYNYHTATNDDNKTNNNNIRHVFAVGIPHYQDNRPWSIYEKRQGEHALPQEIRVAQDILKEYDDYGDVIVAPHRDKYQDLSEKSLAVLKFGVENKCKYIFKVDDEYCMNIDKILSFIAKHELNETNEELYLGHVSFDGTEYPKQMTGPLGDHAKYMSGWLYGVSYKLASTIVTQDWTHSVLHHAYGTSSEDMNMGLWIKHAIKEHNISVKYEADASYLHKIPQGACNVSNE